MSTTNDDDPRLSRRRRQLDELHTLCRPGSAAASRAIDLAFQHFAEFGYDDDVVILLSDAVQQAERAGPARRRLAELCASRPVT